MAFYFCFCSLSFLFPSALLLVKVFCPEPKDPSCRPEEERSRRRGCRTGRRSDSQKENQRRQTTCYHGGNFFFLYCALLDLALLIARQVPLDLLLPLIPPPCLLATNRGVCCNLFLIHVSCCCLFSNVTSQLISFHLILLSSLIRTWASLLVSFCLFCLSKCPD